MTGASSLGVGAPALALLGGGALHLAARRRLGDQH